MKQPAVYILANQRNGTLYIGVTSDLIKRISEHKGHTKIGFTSHYTCKNLVYYEIFDDMTNAIAREKQLKAGSRKKKIDLIKKETPQWKDLYEGLF